MSSNLDRSLDEILAARPRTGRRINGRAAVPPVAGVKKRSQRAAAQKATAQITQASTQKNLKAPTGPKLNGTKIIVSNLPLDVNEGMIKEYFREVVGPVKRATLTYGPDGRSRGTATVEFTRSDHASIAAQKYNGVPVDTKPMKVELVVDAAAPSLATRVGTPNNVAAPKKANNDKPKPVASRAPRNAQRGRGPTRGGRGGNGNGRSKPKTAEQLDQEMADYFDGGSAPAAAAAAPAAAADESNDMDVL